jgi:hypothetical protein
MRAVASLFTLMAVEVGIDRAERVGSEAAALFDLPRFRVSAVILGPARERA